MGTNGYETLPVSLNVNYKWTQDDLFTAIQTTGEFEVVHYHKFAINQLQSKPSTTHFEKLYAHPTREIFYLLALRKRMTNEATIRPYLDR